MSIALEHIPKGVDLFTETTVLTGFRDDQLLIFLNHLLVGLPDEELSTLGESFGDDFQVEKAEDSEALFLSLIPSLEHQLARYLTGSPENSQALAKTIDSALRYLLAQAIFIDPDLGTSLVDEVLVTSSVARENILGERDPKYFAYPQSFALWANHEDNPSFKAILMDLARGPYDLDIKLVARQSSMGRGIELSDPLSYFAEEMSRCLAEVKETQAEENTTWRGRLLLLEKTEMCSSFIEIKKAITASGFSYIEIRFYPKQNQIPANDDQPLFVIHLKMMSNSAREAMGDWRNGANFCREDACILSYKVGSHTPCAAGFWVAPPTARELVGKPIEVADFEMLLAKLNETSQPRTVLLSWALRVLRIALLEEDFLDSIKNLADRSGEVSEKAVLEKLFTSRSVEIIRRLVGKFLATAKDSTTLIQLKMVIKEFYLCLTISPHVTFIFLHLTGLYKLIPCLSHMYDEQWQELLTNPHMIVARDELYRIISSDDWLVHLQTYLSNVDVNRVDGFNGAFMAAEAIRACNSVEPKTLSKDDSFWAYLAKLFLTGENKLEGQITYPACLYRRNW